MASVCFSLASDRNCYNHTCHSCYCCNACGRWDEGTMLECRLKLYESLLLDREFFTTWDIERDVAVDVNESFLREQIGLLRRELKVFCE